MFYTNVLDLIGNTPLISLEQTTGLKVFAKAEFLNPGGSIKDRIALNMIEQAEKDGKLRPGMTIVEEATAPSRKYFTSEKKSVESSLRLLPSTAFSTTTTAKNSAQTMKPGTPIRSQRRS